MDEKKLLEVLSNIEEELIEEATPGNGDGKKLQKQMWVKRGSLAACILLIAGISVSGIQTIFQSAEKQGKEQQGTSNCVGKEEAEEIEISENETTNDVETIAKLEKEEKTELVSNAQNITSVVNNRNRSDYAVDTDTSLPKDNSKEERLDGIPSLSAETTAEGLSDVGFPDWGIALSAENVTASGLTLVCTQSGGKLSGTLQTGSEYKLIVLENGMWNDVPTILEEYGWNSIAYLIENERSTNFEINWEWLYGELPTGTYRLVKSFTDFRGTGEYDSANYWMEFVIQE